MVSDLKDWFMIVWLWTYLTPVFRTLLLVFSNIDCFPKNCAMPYFFWKKNHRMYIANIVTRVIVNAIVSFSLVFHVLFCFVTLITTGDSIFSRSSHTLPPLEKVPTPRCVFSAHQLFSASYHHGPNIYKGTKPYMSAFLMNWPVKVPGGRCLSVWGSLPHPPPCYTHCMNTYSPVLIHSGKGGG